MDNKDTWETFLGSLLDSAVKEFQSTAQYTLLKEKLERMELDCETMLREDERAFAGECFDLLLSVSGQQECYVYKRGIQDSIFILQALGILS